MPDPSSSAPLSCQLVLSRLDIKVVNVRRREEGELVGGVLVRADHDGGCVQELGSRLESDDNRVLTPWVRELVNRNVRFRLCGDLAGQRVSHIMEKTSADLLQSLMQEMLRLLASFGSVVSSPEARELGEEGLHVILVERLVDLLDLLRVLPGFGVVCHQPMS